MDKDNIQYSLLDHQQQVNGNKHPSSDGNEEWIPCFSEAKEPHPTEITEYMRAQELDKEPPFHEWIQDVLIGRNASVSKVKARAKVAHST